MFASNVASAGEIQVGDTGVTFIAPDDFGPVPQEIIDTKWPNNNAPRFVVGNERATTTVAYDLKPHDLSGADLDEVRQSFTQVFDRVIPGIDWKSNRLIEHDGQTWVYFEMSSNAIDTDIYNIMMVTGVGQQMLVFNFNSTREDFPKYEPALRDSVNSIRLPR